MEFDSEISRSRTCRHMCDAWTSSKRRRKHSFKTSKLLDQTLHFHITIIIIRHNKHASAICTAVLSTNCSNLRPIFVLMSINHLWRTLRSWLIHTCIINAVALKVMCTKLQHRFKALVLVVLDVIYFFICLQFQYFLESI